MSGGCDTDRVSGQWEQRLAALGQRRDGRRSKQNDIAVEWDSWSCVRGKWQGSSFTSRLIEGRQVFCVYSSCQPVFVTVRGKRTLLSEEQHWNYCSPLLWSSADCEGCWPSEISLSLSVSLSIAPSFPPLAQGCVMSAPWVSKKNCSDTFSSKWFHIGLAEVHLAAGSCAV